MGAVLTEKESPPPRPATSAAPAARRRRRGDRKQEAAPPSLDLHRLDRATALERLARFLAIQPRGSVVLVVHGRGERILANAVERFLETQRSVAEHEPAPPKWGGAGARVVRLR